MTTTDEANEDAFHVSGPRRVSPYDWNKDDDKRTVLACFVQAAYVIELDRQAQRTEQNALAPGWWMPFKYKFSKTLMDTGDGSIIGVILEWDQSARFSRPSGAPEAVLALRGTLLTKSTTVKDLIEYARIGARGILDGSPRFERAIAEIMSLINLYGSSNVCVAGHSLGAAFALQLVARVLNKERKSVEVHAFNPPCSLLHGILQPVVLGWMWGKCKQLIWKSEPKTDNSGTEIIVPHVYVSRGDHVSAAYRKKPTSDSTGARLTRVRTEVENMDLTAKLYTSDKKNHAFAMAHGLAQWWSEDIKLEMEFVYTK